MLSGTSSGCNDWQQSTRVKQTWYVAWILFHFTSLAFLIIAWRSCSTLHGNIETIMHKHTHAHLAFHGKKVHSTTCLVSLKHVHATSMCEHNFYSCIERLWQTVEKMLMKYLFYLYRTRSNNNKHIYSKTPLLRPPLGWGKWSL